MRQQTWLRHAVFQYLAHPENMFFSGHASSLQAPCAVIHVRRGDVILHGQSSRRYFAIREYIEKGGEALEGKQLLLLTDDQNAIEEAIGQFPDRNWTYVNRTRFRASSGGWENTAPSKNPKLETIIILAEFALAQRCTVFVHSYSSFATALMQDIINRHQGETVQEFKLDDKIDIGLLVNQVVGGGVGGELLLNSTYVMEAQQLNRGNPDKPA